MTIEPIENGESHLSVRLKLNALVEIANETESSGLPDPVGYDGPPVIFNSVDGKVYRYFNEQWIRSTDTADLVGLILDGQIDTVSASKIIGQLNDSQLSEISANKVTGQLVDAQLASLATSKLVGEITNAQITSVAAEKITGQLTDAQLQTISASKVTGELVANQIADGAITRFKLAGGLNAVEVFAALPTTGNVLGRMVYLTSDAKLYRFDGTTFITTTAASDITGEVTNAQIETVAASKITGTLVDSQLAGISTSKLIGEVTNAQITSLAATKITGQITSAQIQSLDSSKITGTLPPNDGSVTLAKFATGLRPIEIVSSFPVSGNVAGRVVFLTTDSKIYRYTGTEWLASLTSADISDAVSANTPNMIVRRDASGDFSAGTITATLTGNAATATKLATSRTISTTGDATGSASFDGTANAAIALTLANSGVTAGAYGSTTVVPVITVDSKGRATSITTASIAFPVTTVAGRTGAVTIASADITDAVSANTPNMLVKRDGSGNFVAGTITAALTGNASTATTLQTARNIALSGDATGSASFNGSANISIAATLSNSGVIAGTYTKVTVDSKGRVTVGAALASSDVTTALGYTPTDPGTGGTISGNMVFTGDVTFQGTTTVVDSTSLSLSDPVITLARNATSTNDGKDRGVEFKYGNGSVVKTGFFGYDTSTGKFVFIPDATNTSEVISGAAGTLVAALEGNASTASNLLNARTIALSGDATGSVAFNGSANVTIATTLANSGVTAATYGSSTQVPTIAVDAKGRITSASNTAIAFPVTSVAGRTGAVTLVSADITDATNLNTASKIVQRDASGNFTAGTITAALTGNASTATTLQTARTIALGGDATGSASFNGSANITITATLANSGVTAASYGSASGVPVITVDAKGRITGANTTPILIATSAVTNLDTILAGKEDSLGFTPVQQGGGPSQTTNKLRIGWSAGNVLRLQVDATDYAGVWPIGVSGNAATATKLATARTISTTGVVTGSASFDGTGNISIATSFAASPTFSGAVTVTTGSAQFPASGIYVQETTHATSTRASIAIGSGWLLLQDANGNGTKDFAIYNVTAGAAGILLSTTNAATFTSSINANGAITTNGAVIGTNNFVIRGGGSGQEGGQLVLGWGNNTATGISGQANNTWNIDVSTSDLRFIAQDSGGTARVPLSISGTTGLPTFNTAPRIVSDNADLRLLTANNRGWRLVSTSVTTTQGSLYLQGSTDGFVSNFTDALVIAPNGDTTLLNGSITGALSFGSSTRQMINLYSTSYGIGVQGSTWYARGSNFAFFAGGVHSNTAYDPGAGGTLLLGLSSSIFQYKGSDVWHTGNLNPSDYVPKSGSSSITGTLSTTGFEVRNTAASTWTYSVIDSHRTTARSVLQFRGSNVTTWEMFRSSDDNFYLSRLNPATGAWIDTPLWVSSATGQLNFAIRPTWASSTPWDSANFDPNTKANSTHNHDAGNITTGTIVDARLPTRLGTVCKTITDWNAAVENGYYMSSTASNAPTASIWYIGNVVVHNSSWVTQTVWAFANNSDSDTMTYRRECNSGSWGSWTRIWQTEAELDARYLLAGNATFNGTTTFAHTWLSLNFTETDGTAGQKRWAMGPEGGNFYLGRLDDAGAWNGEVLYVPYASRSVQFAVRPSFAGATPWDTTNFDPATKANLASPALTGTPTAPTASAGTNTTQLATTAFVTAADNLKASLTGATFTGSIAVRANGGTGYVSLISGDSNPGYVAFYTTTGARAGYVGYSFGGTEIVAAAENGYTNWRFTQRPSFNGATPWDSANFTPGLDLVASGTVSSSTANVEMTIPAWAKSLLLVIRQSRPVSDGGYLSLQFKKSGSWKTATNDYGWNQTFWTLSQFSKWDNGTSGISNMIAICGTIGYASSSTNYVTVEIEPGDTGGQSPSITSRWMYGTNGAAGNGYEGTGGRAEAVRFLYHDRNIGSCKYELYGRR